MKNAILFFALILFSQRYNAQTFINEDTIGVNNYDCYSAYPICENVEGYFKLGTEENKAVCDLKPVYFSFHTQANASNELAVKIYFSDVVLYGPFAYEGIDNCHLIASNLAPNVKKYEVDAVNHYLYFDVSPGFYILEIVPKQCNSEFKVETINSGTFNCETNTANCQNCITSFSPEPGKYLVSGWVKELGVPPTTLSYTHSQIIVSYEGNATTHQLSPSGKIIDGWQRIEGIIAVPTDATDIHLTLSATANSAVFDDIRFYPFDGSMMSYVYDPITLKLVAELDERNYATFYEYDEEGKLIRVKKETEKGIMTIQENRDNITKKQ